MTLQGRQRLVGFGAAVLVPVLIALFVLRGALQDAAADSSARAELVRARALVDAGNLDGAAVGLGAAAREAKPLLEGSWIAHAWSRTFRTGEVTELRRQLGEGVDSLARAVEARRARIEGIRSMRADADYAATLSDLDAIEARRTGFGPLLAADAPAAHEELVGALARRRAEFAADSEANARALRDSGARLDAAGSDPRALLAVIDSVLPRPARADESERLAALKARAAAKRTSVLAGDRLRAAEGRAALAPSAREARGALAAIDADTDLARPADAALADRIAAARAAVSRRIEALESWEASIASVDRALAAGEPGAAARALGALAPCDERTRSVADALRGSFGARALESFAAGAISAADRGDVDALERRADAMRPGGEAWQALASAEREKAAASVAAIDARVDRALYDEFLRAPCRELAARYLDGWPSRVRRMAPYVLEWQARAPTAPIRTALEGARWRGLGLESPARTLEDRPDATIVLRGPHGAEATARAEDIREDTISALGGPSFTVAPLGAAPIRLEATVQIDLRDAVAADPVAKGFEERTAAAWRATRLAEIAVRDPLWGERPHLLLLRVTSPGLVALPPYPRR